MAVSQLGGNVDGIGMIQIPGPEILLPGMHVAVAAHGDVDLAHRDHVVLDSVKVIAYPAGFVRTGPTLGGNPLHWESSCLYVTLDAAGTAAIPGDGEFPIIDAARDLPGITLDLGASVGAGMFRTSYETTGEAPPRTIATVHLDASLGATPPIACDRVGHQPPKRCRASAAPAVSAARPVGRAPCGVVYNAIRIDLRLSLRPERGARSAEASG